MISKEALALISNHPLPLLNKSYDAYAYAERFRQSLLTMLHEKALPPAVASEMTSVAPSDAACSRPSEA